MMETTEIMRLVQERSDCGSRIASAKQTSPGVGLWNRLRRAGLAVYLAIERFFHDDAVFVSYVDDDHDYATELFRARNAAIIRRHMARTNPSWRVAKYIESRRWLEGKKLEEMWTEQESTGR